MVSIKICYNGFKVNGELYKAYFWPGKSEDGREYIRISAKGYGSLPRGFFDVKNDSDPMTDYFDSDSATIFQDHPFFKYVKYAALKCDYMSNKRELRNWKENGYHCYSKEEYQKRVAEFEDLEDVGQPTKADLDAVEKIKIQQIKEHSEKLRKAAEEREANAFMEKLETEMTVNSETEEYPVVEGEAYVDILWSERNGIEDNSRWSLKAADNILRILDAREHEKHSGYDKTAFVIHFPFRGEWSTYEGRYDIGDGLDGLLDHIYRFAEYTRTHENGQLIQDPPETTLNLEVYKALKAMA